ncbi:MAG TPA: anion permease [Solidesulfovibrio sp.]|nr:anion permease [Solidesulfovibrio sp.]
MSFLLPILAYFAMPVGNGVVTVHMALFMAFTVWAVTVWSMDVIDQVAVGIVLPIFYILFCGVQQRVVFGPWLGDVPIIVIGGFTLGKIFHDTGLGKRIGLVCVRAMGGSFTGTLFGICIAGAIIAPLVPSIMGKAAIICALGVSLCDALDFKAKSREATAIMLACLLTVASTKLCYLTGGADLVLGMALVDKILGIKTTWLEYAMYNFLPGMLYTFMSVGLVILLLPSKTEKAKMKANLLAKCQDIGAATAEQKRASYLMVITLLLLATDKFHGISTGIVLIVITFVTFLPGVKLMDGQRFSKINFAPLFFIMGCMAIGSAGGALKVTDWLAAATLPYLHDLGSNMAGLAAYVLGAAVNFLLTPLAATTTMTSPLAELGKQMQVDARALYFSFQYGLDNYIFPYEYAVVLYFFSSGYILFKDMFKVLAIRMVASAAFIFFLAMPYWSMMLK